MSGYTSTPANCPHCGYGHMGACPRVKAIEYHANGTVKRVEYHEPQPVQLPVTPWPPPCDDDLHKPVTT